VESRRALLPAGVRPPFEVYVNGVRQEPGTDYEIRGGEIVFARPLVQEGKLGAKAWFLGFWGVGTYKRNDEIDVRYEAQGQPRVAQGLTLSG
jgi:hypothetical protein